MGLQRCCESLDRGGSLSWSNNLILHHVPIGALEVAVHTFYQATGKPFKHIYFLLLILWGQVGILKLHRMETVKNNSISLFREELLG